MENTTYAGAQMPITLEKKARILAAQMGISRSEFFRLALKSFIELKEKEDDQAKNHNVIKQGEGKGT